MDRSEPGLVDSGAGSTFAISSHSQLPWTGRPRFATGFRYYRASTLRVVAEPVSPELVELLGKLSKKKLAYVASVVTGLLGEMTENRNPKSDLVSDIFLEEFPAHLPTHP